MPRDVTVIFVHGIHARDSEYPREFQTMLNRALPRKLRPHLKCRTVFWGDIVRGRSQLYLNQAQTVAGIADNQYRRLVVEGLGDAAAYQKTRRRENSAYYAIQERLTQGLLDADARDDPTRPLVMVGHSLGCHIISSYAWDLHRVNQLTDPEVAEWDDPYITNMVAQLRAASPFRRLETFAGFVTLGSNMPLFTFTFGPDKVYPITRSPAPNRKPAFPGAALSEATLERARWLNFFSRNDLLGYPLKPLNAAYNEERRLLDYTVYSEGYLRATFLPSALNAFRAHVGYWRNRGVVNKTARLVADIMLADDMTGARRGTTFQSTTPNNVASTS